MRRYTEEVRNFIELNVKGKSKHELTELVNEKFGTIFTASKMKCYLNNHKLKSGLTRGYKAGQPSKVYSEEIIDFIKSNYTGVGPKEMSELINKTFNKSYTRSQIRGYYKNHHLDSGIKGQFPKGHISPNKGRKGLYIVGSEKGWFKKGLPPSNLKPVGSERFGKDGYILIKTAEPNVWRPKHKVLWEAMNGKVPSGHVLTFLDGDKLNLDLDNLALITMTESLVLTKSRLRSSNAEYTKTGIIIAKLRIAQRKIIDSVNHKANERR